MLLVKENLIPTKNLNWYVSQGLGGVSSSIINGNISILKIEKGSREWAVLGYGTHNLKTLNDYIGETINVSTKIKTNQQITLNDLKISDGNGKNKALINQERLLETTPNVLSRISTYGQIDNIVIDGQGVLIELSKANLDGAEIKLEKPIICLGEETPDLYIPSKEDLYKSELYPVKVSGGGYRVYRNQAVIRGWGVSYVS